MWYKNWEQTGMEAARERLSQRAREEKDLCRLWARCEQYACHGLQNRWLCSTGVDAEANADHANIYIHIFGLTNKHDVRQRCAASAKADENRDVLTFGRQSMNIIWGLPGLTRLP